MLSGLIQVSSYQEGFLSSKRTYKVAVLFTWKATHISGADIVLSGDNIVRVADGKIAESNPLWKSSEDDSCPMKFE